MSFCQSSLTTADMAEVRELHTQPRSKRRLAGWRKDMVAWTVQALP